MVLLGQHLDAGKKFPPDKVNIVNLKKESFAPAAGSFFAAGNALLRCAFERFGAEILLPHAVRGPMLKKFHACGPMEEFFLLGPNQGSKINVKGEKLGVQKRFCFIRPKS